MLVSVIIIVKDTKTYLRKCLDSIINQTYTSIEIIVVDDCSNEPSYDIIKDYSEYTSIKYIYSHEAIGPGGARNKGLEIANGQYICFIDSDDWIDLDYIETAIGCMTNTQADIGMASLIRNYEELSYKPIYKCQYDKSISINGITAFKMMSGQYDFGTVISPSPVNKIYKKSYLIQNNIAFLYNVYYEDVLFAFQTLLCNGKVVTIPKVCYHHFRRSGSIVQSLSQKHFDDFEKVFTCVKNFLEKENIYNEFVFHYYKIMERFYNLLIRQVFQFCKDEDEKKKWMLYSFQILKRLINLEEYVRYFNAEDIRRHLQPLITDTTLY